MRHTVPTPPPGAVAVLATDAELFETIGAGLVTVLECSAVWRWDMIHVTRIPRLRHSLY